MTAFARPRERRYGERGSVLLFVVLMLTMMLGVVALSIDLATQNRTKQDLYDTLDAAAHAGGLELPDDADAAAAAALDLATRNDPGSDIEYDFWCVVGASGGAPIPSHIPATCDPGPAPYIPGNYPGMACDSKVCAIPCVPAEGDVCNTIRVWDAETVDYHFAPAIGIDDGSTGTLVSAACRGTCGGDVVGPIDLVAVADRTGSMRSEDVAALKGALHAVLDTLDPTSQHVGLQTIGQSNPSPACPTTPATNRGAPWVIPVGLSSDYDLAGSSLRTAITCLTQSSVGTNLGDPVYTAALEAVSGRPEATPAVLFMTDGAANEPYNPDSASCDYAIAKANEAKAAGATVITIAYRLQNVLCPSPSNPNRLATQVLAEMASDPPNGPASTDDGGGAGGGCTSSAGVSGENGDGDYFFCTPDSGDLDDVFIAATQSLVEGVRLIRLPAGAGT